MKHFIKLVLIMLINTSVTIHATDIYLSSITNQTAQQISWEKLPLPGLLGKMQPQIIDRFDETKPNLQLTPPVTMQFQNPRKTQHTIFLEITISHRYLKRRARTPQEAQKYIINTMLVTLKKTDGTVLRQWSQQLDQTNVYNLMVKLKGPRFQKTEVTIMSQEIPIVMGQTIVENK